MLGGRTDVPLSEEGERMSRALGGLLRSLGAGSAVSSPMVRCTATARLAGLDFLVEEAFRELDLGLWDGLSKAEVQARWPMEFKLRGEDLAGVRPPGGESFQDLLGRVMGGIQALEGLGGTLALVAHRGVCWAVLCGLLGFPLGLYGAVEQDHCGVHVLVRRGGRFVLERSNLSPRWSGV